MATRLDLTGQDLWFTTRFWIFTAEFFITSLFTTKSKDKNQIIINGSGTFNDVKIIVIFWTQNYVDFVPFSVADSFCIVHIRAN